MKKATRKQAIQDLREYKLGNISYSYLTRTYNVKGSDLNSFDNATVGNFNCKKVSTILLRNCNL